MSSPSARLARSWPRWSDYWFVPGGRISAAVLRIAIAIALLWMLWRISNGPLSPDRYYKHGIWMLYPGRPSTAAIAAIMVVACLSTTALLFGLWTRATHAVSAITTMAIAAYAASGQVTWSHGDVPVVLASLALLGARSGDALSIDAWWRVRRGERVAATADYQSSVRLVQFAVAAVFVFACYAKLRAGGWSLGWALSDSLRHHLLSWYDGSGSARTPVVSWLLGAAWRSQLAACLNLVSQLSPVLAVIFARRPWVRAIVAVLWCSEVLALGLVMNLWNLHWLPLAAAFIDWDALAVRLGERPQSTPPVRSRSKLAFVTGFVVFFVAQALWFNQRLHVFPFSAFPMFASVRAKQPYDRHQSYEYVGAHLEAKAAEDPEILTWLVQRSSFRAVWRERKPRELARTLKAVLDEAHAQWPGARLTDLRMWLSIFQAPAYPAPARLDRYEVAVLGELDAGVFRSALGTLLPDGKTWIAPPDAPALGVLELSVIRDDQPEPVAVAATATATGFVLAEPLRGDPVYLIGRTTGTARPWVLAYRARRGY